MTDRVVAQAGRFAGAAVALAVAASAWVATPARGQTRPSVVDAEPAAAAATAAATPSAYAGTGLRRGAKPGAGDAGVAPSSPAANAPPPPTMDTTRVVLSLAAVVGLIFLVKRLGARFVAPAAGRTSTRAVETLSRSVVGPKQHVVLLRVGKRRVLVVSDSGGRLAALDQITDPDEVAELVALVRTEKLGGAANAFGGLFGKSAGQYDKPVTRDERRMLGTEGMRPDDATDDDEPADDKDDKDAVDGSVAATREDLASLLAKVRGVSSRIERS